MKIKKKNIFFFFGGGSGEGGLGRGGRGRVGGVRVDVNEELKFLGTLKKNGGVRGVRGVGFGGSGWM